LGPEQHNPSIGFSHDDLKVLAVVFMRVVEIEGEMIPVPRVKKVVGDEVMCFGFQDGVVDGRSELVSLKILPIVIADEIPVEVDVGDDVLPSARLVGRVIDEGCIAAGDRKERVIRGRAALVREEFLSAPADRMEILRPGR
jgi:hypothetical protein